MRLIDADELKKALREFCDQPDRFSRCMVGYFAALSVIRDAPTIDAVPVIRCKDCKYIGRCGVSATFFCADGKPKNRG